MKTTRYDAKSLTAEARIAVRHTGKELYGTSRARLDGWHIEFRAGMDYIALVARGSVKIPNAARTDFTTSVAI